MPAPVSVPRAQRVAFVLLALLALTLVASTWHTFSHTWDEPEHIASGIELIDLGKYQFDIQHPPLGRLLMAIGPYLAGARSQGRVPPDGRPEGVAILYGSGHYTLYLTLARAGMLPYLLLLLLATVGWAGRTAGSGVEAVIAVALLVSTPAILGHAGLADLDVPAAATMLAGMYTMLRWIETGTLGSAVWLGLACAVAFATKLSAIPFLGLSFLTLLGLNARARSGWGRVALARRVGQLALTALIVCGVLIAAYGGHFDYLTDSTQRYNHALSYLFGDQGRAHDLAYRFAAHVPLPAAFELLVGGVQALLVHNAGGHLSYLLGEVRLHGWWYFYPVALAVKTPLPLLVAGLPGLGLMAWHGWRERDLARMAVPALLAVLLAFACVFSHINIGVRHVLIVYPLLAIGAAHGLAGVWRAAGFAHVLLHHGLRAACVGLLAWQLSVLYTAYPDYLPYFNELVSDPQAVLIDSDLDWGQDLARLERRLAQRDVSRVHLAYQGTADLKGEPLRAYVELAPGVPVDGWVAITALARMKGGAGYGWLARYAPVERIGKTIDLYCIPGPGTVCAAASP